MFPYHPCRRHRRRHRRHHHYYHHHHSVSFRQTSLHKQFIHVNRMRSKSIVLSVVYN